jgi:hypothetical protein
MMKIRYNNIDEFLQWTRETSQLHLNVEEHFPMSSKTFAQQKYNGRRPLIEVVRVGC